MGFIVEQNTIIVGSPMASAPLQGWTHYDGQGSVDSMDFTTAPRPARGERGTPARTGAVRILLHASDLLGASPCTFPPSTPCLSVCQAGLSCTRLLAWIYVFHVLIAVRVALGPSDRLAGRQLFGTRPVMQSIACADWSQHQAPASGSVPDKGAGDAGDHTESL